MKASKYFLTTLFLVIAPLAAHSAILLPGLEAPVKVVRDSNGIPHIYADNEHDLFFMQGRIHAEDRLFQMDLLRRNAAGTLAEVLGTAALQTDIERRTIGLGRAAERSLAAHPQAMRDILQAYSDGVNSYLDAAEAAAQLPPEYAGLGLSSVKRWEPLDSVLVGKALAAETSLIVPDDIDLTIALGTYQAIGAGAGFDGTALFFEDLFRSAPFDPASTLPDAADGFEQPGGKPDHLGKMDYFRPHARARALEQGRDYVKRIRKLPKIPGVIPLEGGGMGGSNSWVIDGRHTPTGRPLLANDIHLRLESPAIFHEVHLAAPSLDATGSSLPGAPCVVRGHNESIAWGITNARLDVTDIYAELVVQDPTSPSGFAIIQNGVQEPVGLVLETFRANVNGSVVPVSVPLPDGDSPFLPVLIAPGRNNGPLITAPAPLDDPPFPGALTALSVQSVGFGPTRDLEGFCGVSRARDLDEFKAAIQFVDFASQNLTYADKKGNIGYFVTGELPLREDLENPTSDITPPFLIRDGFGGNNWIPIDGPLPEDQATPFRILPFAEMPQVVNPRSGVIVNSNNDQAGNTLDNNPLNDFRENGTGLLYLNWGGRNFSLRAGRETEMINERLSRGDRRFWRAGKISFADMKSMQADTVLNDARALTPFILDAYDNATASGAHPVLAAIAADPRLSEAVSRLRGWDFTTPTGISEGYDANPGAASVDASVATTIYSVWRGNIVANTIDATLDYLGAVANIADLPRPANREEVVTALKHLLERDGVGVSGLNFFNVPGVAIDEPAIRRDIVVLESLRGALDLLAADEFAPAFANSGNQDDYRWGRLHRLVLDHPLGGVEGNFNVPPGFGLFPAPLAGLDGIPIDGGFETVDEAPPLDVNNVRVGDSDSFMVEFGAVGRFVARAGRRKVTAVTSLAGGESAVPGSPFYLNLLEPWLRNETFPMLVSPYAVKWGALSIQEFTP